LEHSFDFNRESIVTTNELQLAKGGLVPAIHNINVQPKVPECGCVGNRMGNGLVLPSDRVVIYDANQDGPIRAVVTTFYLVGDRREPMLRVISRRKAGFGQKNAVVGAEVDFDPLGMRS
jgi:hypothetical protein